MIVEELDRIGGDPKPNGRVTTLFLNPDPSAPLNPLRPGNVDQTDEAFDIGRFEVHDIEISNAEKQDINAPQVKNQAPYVSDWSGSFGAPRWENPRWENPRWENPRWENPRWENPRWENPRWENEGWENFTISDGEVQNGSFRHVSAAYTNIGNTTSAYNVRVVVTGASGNLEYQLIAYKLYTTTGQDACEFSLVGNTQVLVNIPEYDPSPSNLNSPPRHEPQNTTIHLHPGETVYTVLVAFDPDSDTFDEQLDESNVLFAARPQAVNTVDAANGITVPPLVFNGSPGLQFGEAGRPTDTFVNTPLGQNNEVQGVQVLATNSDGAVIPSLEITIALGANSAGGTLSGTLTRSTNNFGVANFDDLTIDTAGTGYTLVASARNATSATSQAFSIATMVGTVTDADGDSTGGAGAPPDLVSAALTVNVGNLNVSVRFAPGTFDSATTLVNLAIDADSNASTGSQGVDSGCVNDATSVGTDFVINASSAFYGSSVVVSTYANQATPPDRTCNTYGSAEVAGSVTFLPDGVDFSIPLSALGGDDGQLRFKVLTATYIPDECPGCFTEVQDYMPNVGLAPGQVPTPPPPDIGLLHRSNGIYWSASRGSAGDRALLEQGESPDPSNHVD